MAKKKQEYNNESITSLKGADRVRLRPAVIFGSDGLEGCQHSVFEILSNSVDEAREGYGDKIIVTKYKDNVFEIEDFGRGIPVDYNNAEGRYNWELVYCEMYAGGKYKNNSGGSYQYSLGLNGLGACATQYTSEFMDVTVFKDGKKYSLHFEKGENIGGLKVESYDGKRTGSIQRWRPDIEVFTDINISGEYFKNILEKQAIVNKGIKFIFKEEIDSGFETTEFYYKNGISEYVEKKVGMDKLCEVKFWESQKRGRVRQDREDYDVLISVAFTFAKQGSFLEYYHNSSFLEHGGSPEKAVKNAFLYEFDAFIRSNNKYNKNEPKIIFQDIEDCLCLITNTFSQQTSYENQTKKAITNKFIQEAITQMLRSNLEIYFLENKDEALKVADQILINKRSREKAEKERVNIKKKLSGNIDISNRVAKFVDCRTKDKSLRELYIVEGDSALGSCKTARDETFQAIMPVRGKILNCLKADVDKIFKSEIITDLLKVMGCGVEMKSKANKSLSSFNIDDLKWNKVIICTDADVDGYQIRTLILAMLYALTPKLIEEGFVYIAESPLYEINTKKDTYFAYDENEKNKILKKLGDQKYQIQRSKGLGENEPEMMSKTTMKPETRRLIKVTPEDREETEKMFDILLGNNLQGRKNLISEKGYMYIDETDLS